MQFRFLHCADVHLGKNRHLGDERYGDYFTAFESVIEYAIRHRVDAVCIAGDLFDEQEPAADTLIRAAGVLRALRSAAIPAFAIEGNHDRRKRTESACALDILAGEGYLRLLRPVLDQQSIALPPFDGTRGAVARAGERIAIAGLGFIGHNTEQYFREAVAQLPEDAFTIVLFHTMVAETESALDYGCCLFEEIAGCASRVGYLALGHRHTRTGTDDRFGGWVYNPGSLEFVNPFDYRQAEDLRGFFDVTVTDADTIDARDAIVRKRNGFTIALRHVPTRKRPVRSLRVDISDCAEPDAVPARALEAIAAADSSGAAPGGGEILILRLTGSLLFPRSLIPRAEVSERAREATQALMVEIIEQDLYASDPARTLLIDADRLEQVADRARAILAALLRERGLAVGNEDDFALALMEAKTLLAGAPLQPGEDMLESLRVLLQPFVPRTETPG